MNREKGILASDSRLQFEEELRTLLAVICRLTGAKGGWITLEAPGGFGERVARVGISEKLDAEEDGGIDPAGPVCPCRLENEDLAPTGPTFVSCARYQDDQGRPLLHACIPLTVDGMSGGVVNLLLAGSALPFGPDSELLVMVRRLIEGVLERQRLEERLRRSADYDSLTGVYNRRRFQERLADVLTQTERGTLLFVDFDNFKAINDNLGHRAGDKLLGELIGSLRGVVQGNGFLGRIGGDEFALFLPGATLEQAKMLGGAIERVFRRHRVLLNGRRVIMTASIGIAEFPTSGSTVEQLLARADTAMYTAKRTGTHVHVYDPFQLEEVSTTQELLWTTRIREALEGDGLLLYAQPILELQSGRVSRYELLLRMRGDNGELISPKAFLGVAEKTDLMHRIDLWVVKEAIRILDSVCPPESNFCFHVNLSAKIFADSGFPTWLSEQLSRSRVDASRLLFEITETAAIEDYARARDFIRRVRGMGFRFALDDFGIGFSSLYSLKYLPLDVLKIDGVFIQDLAHSRVDQSLVKGLTISMAELGIQTVAEFVEDEQTVGILQEYGVTYAQGFHIGRPMPIVEILDRSA